MAKMPVCPKCGAAVDAEAIAGNLCPRCLLVASLISTISPASSTSKEGGFPDEFDSYYPVGVLGEGGMGIVYLAEQHEPIRRRVALKVLKRNREGGDFLARFEAECQALAIMDHPNIARVYDAGFTKAGQPYFVMEYVPGIPITDYADRNQLVCRDRLALFEQVCEAVHHAHQKGIIHRDLKPSNILVMLHDGKPVPKVIDFGVAKAINRRLTERTLFTEFGVLIGTPEYMSPEQAELTGLDVDTRTDIYSLGLLLYELLVGSLPFDVKTLRAAGYAEILRIIREQEAPRLSTRLHRLGPTAVQIAKKRRSDVGTLSRALRGDLEWITMKAIEKDRTRRYASASELAADVRRHLSDEAVLASPPSATYRLRKYARKNKGKLVAAVLVLLSLVTGLIASTLLYLHAEKQRETAEWEGYRAQMAAARSEILAFRPDSAKRLLFASPFRLRGWEWRHLYALADSSRMTTRATATMTAFPRVGFSDDSSRLWVAMRHTVHEFDRASGEELARHGPFPEILAMNRDGSRIVVRGREPADLVLMPPANPKAMLRLDGHASPPKSVAFTVDGSHVATASPDGEIRLWDADSGKLIRRIAGPKVEKQHPIITVNNLLAISPGASRIAYSIGEDAILWDANTGARIAALSHRNSLISSVLFSDDGKYVYTAVDAVRVWDAGSGKAMREHVIPGSSFVRLATPSPDGQSVLVSGFGEEVYLIREGIFSPLPVLGATQQSAAIGFSRDGSFAAVVSTDGEVKVWETAPMGGMGYQPSRELVGETKFSRNGTYGVFSAVTPDGAALAVWDTQSGRELAIRRWKPAGEPRNRNIVAVSSNGSVALGGHGNSIALWERGASEPRILEGSPAPVERLAFRPDGRELASVAPDQVVRIWDVATGRQLRAHPANRDVWELEFSVDGRQLAISGPWLKGGRPPSAELLDVMTGATVRALVCPQQGRDPIRVLSFSPDGRLLAGQRRDGALTCIWEVASGRLVGSLEEPGSAVGRGVAFSPDGSRIATSQTDQTLTLWDATTFQQIVAMPRAVGANFTFTPDGRILHDLTQKGVLELRLVSAYDAVAEQVALNALAGQTPLDAWKKVHESRSIPQPARKAASQFLRQAVLERQNEVAGDVFAALMEPKSLPADYRTAQQQAEILSQIDPLDRNLAPLVALAAYRTGQLDEAVRKLRGQTSAGLIAYATLAMSQHKLGLVDQAREALEQGRAVLARAPRQGPLTLRLWQEAESMVSGKK